MLTTINVSSNLTVQINSKFYCLKCYFKTIRLQMIHIRLILDAIAQSAGAVE